MADRVQAGSSLKFCLIAEGKADIYPRFGPTNEWDTAAGQGVLEAAGGEVVTTDGRPLAYGKPGFGNPHFIARSKAARERRPASIDEAARLIREGELVAFPTETVYGLGGDATNERAVAKIFEAKGRPQFNPLISHVLDAGEARRLVQWNDDADKLAARFWPGPLTLVLPRAKNSPIALLATAGLDTAAIRAPAHPDGAGADPRRRPADRGALGQPQRRRQPDTRRACRRIAGRPREADPRWRAVRGRPGIDGARPHDRHADAAAPRRRHARGDRGGDRARGPERRHPERRRRPQIAGPARQPLRAGAARCG